MKTINEQLAEALRIIVGPEGREPCSCYDAGAHECDYCNGREALAAYDAQRASSETVRAEGQEHVGHDWDNGPQAFDVIRNSGEEWFCLADPRFTARIVDALNSTAERDPQSDPAAILVHAFADASSSGRRVPWEVIETAHAAAREQLGPEHCAEIDAIYS